ncbi:MAG: DUF6918 family protein [Stenotrophobium sp.]
MDTLTDILWVPAHKGALITGCVQLIESRIASRGGLKGMALKTGLSMLKARKPGILERATAKLLPDFIAALDPLYQQCVSGGNQNFPLFLQLHAPRATQALLTVADRRVAASDSHSTKATYAKLRGSAETEVLAGIPGLAKLIGQHLP